MANGLDRSWDTPPNVQGSIACFADWDPSRGLHQGQQSSMRLHQQAEDKTASDPRQISISSLAMREPSRQALSASLLRGDPDGWIEERREEPGLQSGNFLHFKKSAKLPNEVPPREALVLPPADPAHYAERLE